MISERSPGWERRRRTAAEALQAEVEVYLLVNFGGVEQTDQDRQRAEAISQPQL